MLRILLATLALSCSMSALAQLQIYPFRATLDAQNKSQEFEVINTGNEQMTVRMSLISREKDGAGNWQSFDLQSSAHDASSLIRFSPKQTTLRPGESQKVRVFAKSLNKLNGQEKRTHLLFAQQPNTGNKISIGEDAIGGSVGIVFNISVPVVVRPNNSQTTANISATKSSNGIVARLSRTGNQSLHGTIEVANSRGQVIARMDNASVHVPYASEEIYVPYLRGYSSSDAVGATVSYTDNDGRAISASATVN